MDLRVKRTLTNIKQAFFTIKKRKTIDKISVKELSEKAMINKATFYLHFKDIYDLADKLEKDLIEEIMTDIRKCNLTGTRESYANFITAINLAVIKYNDNIEVLFSQEGKDKFLVLLEKSVIEYVKNQVPQWRYSEETDIMVSYMVYGSYHILNKKEYSKEKLLELSTKYAMALMF